MQQKLHLMNIVQQQPPAHRPQRLPGFMPPAYGQQQPPVMVHQPYQPCLPTYSHSPPNYYSNRSPMQAA